MLYIRRAGVPDGRTPCTFWMDPSDAGWSCWQLWALEQTDAHLKASSAALCLQPATFARRLEQDTKSELSCEYSV